MKEKYGSLPSATAWLTLTTVSCKQPDAKELPLYGSIYMKTNNRPDWLATVRIMLPQGWGYWRINKECGNLLGVGNILCPDLGGGYMMLWVECLCSLQNACVETLIPSVLGGGVVWEVIRIRGAHEEGALMKGLVPLGEPQGSLLPPPPCSPPRKHTSRVSSHNPEENSHQDPATLAAPWSQASSLQDYEK